MATGHTARRATQIHAPAAGVYPLVADLRRWRAWSPLERLDPAMERAYTGPSCGVGSAFEWSGRRRVGTGRMLVTEASEPASVVVEQRTTRPSVTRSTSRFTLVESVGVTTVTWTLDSTTSRVSGWLPGGRVVRRPRLVRAVRVRSDPLGAMLERGLAALARAAEAG